MDVSALDLIEIAGDVGYDHVSLFTHNPVVPHAGQEGRFVYPTVTQETKREVLSRLAAHGLSVLDAEFFLMTPDIPLESYRSGLALGRELGARHAMTHVFDTDRARAVDILGNFADLAAAEDLTVTLEFCQMTPGCRSIQDASWFVDQVGRSNVGFGICPMHLVRSGGTAADVAARPVLYGQINDGKGLHVSEAYFEEVHDREMPGDGDFPLHDIISALPASAPIEVKLPRDSRIKAGQSARAHAKAAYDRARPIVDGLKPTR
jgi:sugar phosphate isomerase/epimerase